MKSDYFSLTCLLIIRVLNSGQQRKVRPLREQPAKIRGCGLTSGKLSYGSTYVVHCTCAHFSTSCSVTELRNSSRHVLLCLGMFQLGKVTCAVFDCVLFPTVQVQRSDRELARLYVEMFRPIGDAVRLRFHSFRTS